MAALVTGARPSLVPLWGHYWVPYVISDRRP
jgi:hypothetical protein